MFGRGATKGGSVPRRNIRLRSGASPSHEIEGTGSAPSGMSALQARKKERGGALAHEQRAGEDGSKKDGRVGEDGRKDGRAGARRWRNPAGRAHCLVGRRAGESRRLAGLLVGERKHAPSPAAERRRLVGERWLPSADAS